MVRPGSAIQRVEPFTVRPRPGMNTITSTTNATGNIKKRNRSSNAKGTAKYTKAPAASPSDR